MHVCDVVCFPFSITLPALDSGVFTHHLSCPRCPFPQICQGCSQVSFFTFYAPSLSLSTTCRSVTCGPRSVEGLLGRARKTTKFEPYSYNGLLAWGPHGKDRPWRLTGRPIRVLAWSLEIKIQHQSYWLVFDADSFAFSAMRSPGHTPRTAHTTLRVHCQGPGRLVRPRLPPF